MKLFSIVSVTFFLLGNASAGIKLAAAIDRNPMFFQKVANTNEALRLASEMMKSLEYEMDYHRKHTEFPKYLDLVKNNQEQGRKLDIDDRTRRTKTPTQIDT